MMTTTLGSITLFISPYSHLGTNIVLLEVPILDHSQLLNHQPRKRKANSEMVRNTYHTSISSLLILLKLVQSKALAGAKSFGSFLYSAVNKAGKTVSEASAKIKETVEKNVCKT